MQITAESVRSSIARFYESAAFRDMFQNHPASHAHRHGGAACADAVHDEKVKVLRGPRWRGRRRRDDPRPISHVSRRTTWIRSQTATFGAPSVDTGGGRACLLLGAQGFLLRTTQIVTVHHPPHMMFESGSKRFHNRLVLQIQPAEGIQIHFMTKVPDSGMKLRMTDLDFSFRNQYAGGMPEAYQRLLLDVINGDASLFARSDEVELAWGIIDPIQRVWESSSAPPLAFYAEGDWGPAASSQWMAGQGRAWFDLCPVLH